MLSGGVNSATRSRQTDETSANGGAQNQQFTLLAV
jgi:hypothetical protein